MSLTFKIYKKQRNIILLLVKKKWWNYEVYLPQNGLCLSSEEAEKPPHKHAHAGCSVLNSQRGHNEDTCSASLKYYIQDITVNNYHFISLKIIMLVFIT